MHFYLLICVYPQRILNRGWCLQGAGSLAKLVGEAGRGITIVAAGNVTNENIAEIVRRTGVVEVHSSARR